MIERAKTPFHLATATGDVEAMARLLAEGADVEARWDFAEGHGPFLEGFTPLMTAAASDQGATAATLWWLVEHGANPRAVSAAGVTAAWYAASGIPWWVRPPTFDGSNAERLAYLLDLGLDPNESTGNGRSLIIEAAEAGDPTRVRLLLERGAAANPRAGIAAELDRDVRRSVERRVDRELAGMCVGLTATEIDELRAKLLAKSAHLLPDAADEASDAPYSFMIPIFAAAEAGSAESVELLLAAGVSPDVRDCEGATALMHAGSPDVVRTLVAAGADVRAENRAGNDVLGALLAGNHERSTSRRFEIAKALLDAGAPLLRLGPFGSSRLHAAAFALDADLVDFFVGQGVVPAADSREDETPLHAVCWQDGYDAPGRRVAIERIVRALVAAGNPVDGRDARGSTPLHQACGGDGGNESAVEALVSFGADLEPRDASGATPLIVAARQGEVGCIRRLLAAGADVSAAGTSGETALAAARSNRDIRRSLVAEAKPDKVERYKKALDEAEQALALIERAHTQATD